MKKTMFCLVLLCVGISCLAEDTIERINRVLRTVDSKEVLVVAHRGDWRNAPENSIYAIELAIEMGVDIVEVDVQRTKDGKLVLMHDVTLDRTTSGKGRVADYTLEELKQFKLRSGTSMVLHHDIPTFEECMLAARGKIMVNIDKGYDYLDEIMPILERTGTTRQAIMKATQLPSDIAKAHPGIFEKIYFMPMMYVDKASYLDDVLRMSAKVPIHAVELIAKSPQEAEPYVRKLAKHGIKSWLNALGSVDAMSVDYGKPDAGFGVMVEKGISIIQTDRPRELIQYLKQRKLSLH